MNFEEKLIEEVRRHKIIYNLQHKQYRQVDKKHLIWMNIAGRLNTNVDICRKRWKNLRDTYKKYRRQDYMQSGSSAPEVKRKWKYLELLSFLDQYGIPKSNYGNDPPEVNAEADITWEDSNISNSSMDTTIQEEKVVTFGDNLPSTSETLVSVDNVDSTYNTRANMSRKTPKSRISSKKRVNEEIKKRFAEFISLTATNISAACKVQSKDSTLLLFEALAAKISKANLTEAAVNEIEAEVTSLVYGKLAKFSNALTDRSELTFCRICYERSHLIHLSDEIYDKFIIFANIKVFTHFRIPNFICVLCYNDLKVCERFYKRLENSIKKLRQLMPPEEYPDSEEYHLADPYDPKDKNFRNAPLKTYSRKKQSTGKSDTRVQPKIFSKVARCDDCSMNFDDFELFYKHRNAHNEMFVRTDLALKRLPPDFEEIYPAASKIQENIRVPCTQCSDIFFTTLPFSMNCVKCWKKFENCCHLKSHYQDRHKSKSFICIVCGKSSSDVRIMYAHLSTHEYTSARRSLEFLEKRILNFKRLERKAKEDQMKSTISKDNSPSISSQRDAEILSTNVLPKQEVAQAELTPTNKKSAIVISMEFRKDQMFQLSAIKSQDPTVHKDLTETKPPEIKSKFTGHKMKRRSKKAYPKCKSANEKPVPVLRTEADQMSIENTLPIIKTENDFSEMESTSKAVDGAISLDPSTFANVGEIPTEGRLVNKKAEKNKSGQLFTESEPPTKRRSMYTIFTQQSTFPNESSPERRSEYDEKQLNTETSSTSDSAFIKSEVIFGPECNEKESDVVKSDIYQSLPRDLTPDAINLFNMAPSGVHKLEKLGNILNPNSNKSIEMDSSVLTTHGNNSEVVQNETATEECLVEVIQIVEPDISPDDAVEIIAPSPEVIVIDDDDDNNDNDVIILPIKGTESSLTTSEQMRKSSAVVKVDNGTMAGSPKSEQQKSSISTTTEKLPSDISLKHKSKLYSLRKGINFPSCCAQCKTMVDLKEHLIKQHRDKCVVFTCKTCGKIFKELDLLAQHLKDHHNTKLVKMDVSGGKPT